MVHKKINSSASSAELTPDDIRRIREGLGLSQAEAGELLGGGPRAFTKYESGAIQPAASVANLLRLLEASPQAASTLLGAKARPLDADPLGPLRVSGKHVAALADRKLVLLVRKLLTAEALSEGLPLDGIHVAANITAPDGGEDARIEWSGGPDRTPFLPSRFCLLQIKATAISPAEAGGDVIDSAGRVKAMVSEAVTAGGTYIMVCGRSYTMQEIGRRAGAISKRLKSAGLPHSEAHVQFRDADQVADWVNAHPPVAAWLLSETQPGLAGPFRDWLHWAGRHEYESAPWVQDDRLAPFREKLRNLVRPTHGVARIVGLSGYGKSRLTLEALAPTDEEEASGVQLRELVLYAVEQEVGPETIKRHVQTMVDAGVRAIVVVDRCPQESHQDLVAMIKRSNSRLSLITIDHEVTRRTNLPDDTILVDEAPRAVIEGMLSQTASQASDTDRPRLVKLASGFPQLARLIADAWLKDISIAKASDEVLFNRILLGRPGPDVAKLQSSAMLLGAFGLVGARTPLDSDLNAVAPFGHGIDVGDLRSSIDDLTNRGVAQMRGRLVALQPRPVALHLAERQWRSWDSSIWDHILFGPLPPRLRKHAALQLALLNEKPISREVVKHVCRAGGPIGSARDFCTAGHSEVISSLAEIDSEIVIDLLERLLHGLSQEELRQIDGDGRRHLVWAIEKIAFVADTFERGALLLLQLALAENETWGNNATGQFKALFPALLGNTSAGPKERLRVLDELLGSNDAARLQMAVHALGEGAKVDFFTRTVGVEVHGSRAAMKPWTPTYWHEAWDYVRACASHLAKVAVRDDEVGTQARNELAGEFRSYVCRGMIAEVEQWVAEVSTAQPYWPRALERLGDVLQYDQTGLEADVVTRVEALIAKLRPDDRASRVRFLVTEMPWDYPIDEKLDFRTRHDRQVSDIEALAKELLPNPTELIGYFPALSIDSQRMAFDFGRALALHSHEPLSLEQPITNALLGAEPGKRNFSLLSGYMVGLATRAPDVFARFKKEAAHSAELAPVFAFAALNAGLTPSDVQLMCDAIEAETMPAHALHSWSGGGELAKLPPEAVVPLFDLLFQRPGPWYSLGLELFGMYVLQHPERLEALRPQIKLVAANVKNAEKRRGGSRMDDHHFEEVMKWLLAKGDGDRDAADVALMLARALVDDPNGVGQELIRPQLAILLSRFSHIVWPIIGSAIVGDQQLAWRLQLPLGDAFAFDSVKHPMIAHLPEDLLFAWCQAHPDSAPAFVAGVVGVLTHRDPNAAPPEFDRLTRRLLDEFGARDDVLRALVNNIHSFGWSGSRTNYYRLYEAPLKGLADHPIGAVRRWAKKMLVSMQGEIQSAKDEDDELRASWDE